MSDITDRLDALEAALKANQLPATLAILQRKLEQTWQPDASVLLQPGSITGDLLPDASITDAKLNLAQRRISGVVASDGSITSGTGFSVSKTGTGGAYTVTWDTAFSAAPAVPVTPHDTSNASSATTGTPGTGSVLVRTFNASGTLTDRGFSFIAIGTA